MDAIVQRVSYILSNTLLFFAIFVPFVVQLQNSG